MANTGWTMNSYFKWLSERNKQKKKILILNKYTSHQLRNPHAIHVHTHTLEVIFYNIHLFVLPCTFKHKDNWFRYHIFLKRALYKKVYWRCTNIRFNHLFGATFNCYNHDIKVMKSFYLTVQWRFVWNQLSHSIMPQRLMNKDTTNKYLTRELYIYHLQNLSTPLKIS